MVISWTDMPPLLPHLPPKLPQKVGFSYYVLGKINKATVLNFDQGEHGNEVNKEESPYKPDPVVLANGSPSI
jgi:hypothetical protein